MKKINKKKFKFFLNFSIFSIIIISLAFTFSKFKSNFEILSNQVYIAKPILEISYDDSETDVVRNSSITRYFSVMNYKNNKISEVGLNYYIYLVNENDELITNAKMYYQTNADNPNEYTEINKITSGNFTNYFQGTGFTTSKATHNYKFVIDNIDGYSKVKVKVKAEQKEVN